MEDDSGDEGEASGPDEELESSLSGGGPGTALAADDVFSDDSGVDEDGGVLDGGEARGTFLTSIMLRMSNVFSLSLDGAVVGVCDGVNDGLDEGVVEGGGGLEE